MSEVGIEFALIRGGLKRGEIRHEKTSWYRHERFVGVATLRVRCHRADRRHRSEPDEAPNNSRYPTVGAAANGRHTTDARANGGHARARAAADGGGGSLWA